MNTSEERYKEAILICTACGKPVHPRDHAATKILCPNCEKTTIVRCSKCRKIGNIAKCPSCGYVFP